MAFAKSGIELFKFEQCLEIFTTHPHLDCHTLFCGDEWSTWNILLLNET